MKLPRLNLDLAAGRDEAPAITCDGERLSYADLRRRTAAIAARLGALGLRRRDRLPDERWIERAVHAVVSWLMRVGRRGVAANARASTFSRRRAHASINSGELCRVSPSHWPRISQITH